MSGNSLLFFENKTKTKIFTELHTYFDAQKKHESNNLWKK